jgi:Delta3-Delta2-enoyl-CoA isomerase
MVELDRQDGVFVLRMNQGENRFNVESVRALNAALDSVEHSPEPTALVTTGSGKFYSNGLDLEWIAQQPPADIQPFIGQVHELLARMLTFPVITVAAVNGHAFAAGAMLMLAHDFRLMRKDRGYFCLPEVDIQIPFTGPMKELIQARLPRLTAHEAMVTGRRYTAEQAVAREIVEQAHDEADVLPQAIALAKSHAGKARATLAAIKRGAYPQMLEAVEAYARSAAPPLSLG